MTIQFCDLQEEIVQSFSGALLPPGIQRHDMLQQKPTLGGNENSGDFKIFQYVLRRTFLSKMSFLFKLNNPKMKLQMEQN